MHINSLHSELSSDLREMKQKFLLKLWWAANLWRQVASAVTFQSKVVAQMMRTLRARCLGDLAFGCNREPLIFPGHKLVVI